MDHKSEGILKFIRCVLMVFAALNGVVLWLIRVWKAFSIQNKRIKRTIDILLRRKYR